jgi:hypothetical protein
MLLRKGYGADGRRNLGKTNGVLDAGTHLFSKPFNLEELATKVRTLLDGA